MAIIDPEKRKQERKEEGFGERPEKLEEEVKVHCAVVGSEKYLSSGKKSPGTLIRFVVTHGVHAGKYVECTIWDSYLQKLGDLAVALQWENPFDTDDEEAVDQVLVNALVLVTVKADDWTNSEGETKTKYEAAFFSKSRRSFDDDGVKDIITAGEAGFTRYLEWRDENPRGSYGNNSSGSSSGGGGYGGYGSGSGGGDASGGGYGGGSSSSGGSSGPAEDIPF